MGYDVPAALGVAIASQKEVNLVTGDGSFMMNMQELATIKHNNLPVRITIFSNDGYNGIRQTCKNYFNGKNVGCDKESARNKTKFVMTFHDDDLLHPQFFEKVLLALNSYKKSISFIVSSFTWFPKSDMTPNVPEDEELKLPDKYV